MKLKDQVVSLELAKKLKELGFNQESLFYWLIGVDYESLRYFGSSQKKLKFLNKGFDIYPAYTVAELGKMLPKPYIKIGDSLLYINNPLKDENNKFIIALQKLSGGSSMSISESINLEDMTFRDKIEANARAKMLIYLKENKLIKNI